MPDPAAAPETAPPHIAPTPARWAEAILFRAILFAGLWAILAGVAVDDWPGMAIGVTAALLTSLALSPPAAPRVGVGAALRLAARFVRLSAVGGLDVGRRALHPRAPMRPAVRTRASDLPPGAARDLMRAFTTAVPGVLACGETGGGALMLHCLDSGQNIDEGLDVDERLIARALCATRSAGKG